MSGLTLFQKLWDAHVVHVEADGTTLLYICLLYTSDAADE